MLVRNHTQKHLVCGCRDVVQDKLNAALRVQELNGLVAVRTIWKKEDVKSAVILPTK